MMLAHSMTRKALLCTFIVLSALLNVALGTHVGYGHGGQRDHGGRDGRRGTGGAMAEAVAQRATRNAERRFQSERARLDGLIAVAQRAVSKANNNCERSQAQNALNALQEQWYALNDPRNNN